MNTSTLSPVAIELARIPSGTLLAVGDCNHDFYLNLYSGNGASRGVRAVPKEGSGCVESGFGSVLYWINQVRKNPAHYPVITAEGEAFRAASRETLREIGADWGQTGT